MEVPRNLLASRKHEPFLLGRQLKDRERPVSLRAVSAGYFEEKCNRDAQAKRKCNEVPQGGKSEQEDERTAGSKEKAHEAAAERKFMHGDAGMAIGRHSHLRYSIYLLTTGLTPQSPRLQIYGRVMYSRAASISESGDSVD